MRYQLHGTTMQTVAIDLARGDSLYSQSATMAWMTDGVRMDTHTGGGLMAGLKRMFSGSGLFVTEFTAETDSHIAFAPRFPGQILPV
ncbi:MAG TPA: AIM24 family protein, partial [Novosphingobium sp.]|nr:AIM24 family protein [Novosphingobium sp.]